MSKKTNEGSIIKVTVCILVFSLFIALLTTFCIGLNEGEIIIKISSNRITSVIKGYISNKIGIEFLQSVSIGVFCSTVLVLFVEGYHESRTKITKKENREVLLRILPVSLHPFKDRAKSRCKKIAVLTEHKYDEDLDILENLKIIEVPFLIQKIDSNNNFKNSLFFNYNNFTSDAPIKAGDLREIAECYCSDYFRIGSLEKAINSLDIDALKLFKIIDQGEFELLKKLRRDMIKLHEYLGYTGTKLDHFRGGIIEKYESVIDSLLGLNKIISEYDY